MQRTNGISRIRQALVGTLALLAALAAGGTAQAGTATESPVFVVTEVSPDVFIYNAAVGTFLTEFDGHFTEDDAVAAGDIFGNGLNFVMVAGDETNVVEIFEPLGGRLLYAWNMAYTLDDGFAAGDWDGDGRAEVFVAGDETGIVDVFDPRTGAHLAAFDGASRWTTASRSATATATARSRSSSPVTRRASSTSSIRAPGHRSSRSRRTSRPATASPWATWMATGWPRS